MKRILALILSVVLMLGIAVPAYAIGDENIDSGGGNLGNGTPAWTASAFLLLKQVAMRS